MRIEPIATGARAAPERTAAPTVKTRKKVPMNSTRYFFMWVKRWFGYWMNLKRCRAARGLGGRARLMSPRSGITRCPQRAQEPWRRYSPPRFKRLEGKPLHHAGSFRTACTARGGGYCLAHPCQKPEEPKIIFSMIAVSKTIERKTDSFFRAKHFFSKAFNSFFFSFFFFLFFFFFFFF